MEDESINSMEMEPVAFEKQFQVLNWTQSLERVDGDETLLRELAALFLEDMPTLIREMENAIASGDSGALARAAHTLKGSVANFGAEPVYDAALAIEQAAKSQTLDDPMRMVSRLEAALRALTPELQSLAGA
jgi:HPt (histidine-containing phosphotransfer) domain-containing protein